MRTVNTASSVLLACVLFSVLKPWVLLKSLNDSIFNSFPSLYPKKSKSDILCHTCDTLVFLQVTALHVSISGIVTQLNGVITE